MAFHRIEEMPSRESFAVMHDFAEKEVTNRRLQFQLLNRLEQRRPFANFKRLVEQSSTREAWFAYRDQRYEEYVQRQLNRMSDDYDEEE